jgi:hypothetical protein
MTPLTPCEPGRVTMPIFHSTEQGTLPTTPLISKHAIPYRTRGDTSYPRVSTPKTWSLVDSSISTTNHEGRNLPHHSKPCSKNNIESHHGHLTSWQMEDQHSQHSTQVKLNIIKMERHVRRLKTAGLSNTTNHKNSILKYESIGNHLMHVASVY